MGRFPTAAHLASWAGVCPGNNESAGKHRSGTDPQGLQVAARLALSRGRQGGRAATKDTYLAAQYAPAAGRRGPEKADRGRRPLDPGDRLARARPGRAYQDLGDDYFQPAPLRQHHQRQLVRQLERLGHKVTLEPIQAA